VYSVRLGFIHVERHLFDPGLTLAGISSKDQIVNGQDFKKNDRIFLDTATSNLDVCLITCLPLSSNSDIFLAKRIQKSWSGQYRPRCQGLFVC
jgi:hypothetical protein